MGIPTWMTNALPAAMAGSALALALAGCVAVQVPASNQPVVHHRIDPAAWVLAVGDQDQAPGLDAWVVFNADRSFEWCGMRLDEDAAWRIGSTEVLFGSACGRQFVLLAPAPSIDTPLERRLAAAHESFHQAIQYNALRPRLDRVEFPGELSPEQFATLRRFLGQLVDDLRGPAGAAGACRLFHGDFAALDPATQQYLLFKAYWEWPAEHYMRTAVIPGASFDEYERMRMEMGADHEANVLYTAGIAAFDVIERSVGRARWQRAYADGETPINLLMRAGDCRPLHRRSVLVDIDLEDIFE